MTSEHLIIRYVGADADNHNMNMYQLGQSLIGIDRLIKVGLFSLEKGRAPKRNEKLPFAIKVSEPKVGSYEFVVQLYPAIQFLPLISDFYTTRKGLQLTWHWLSGVLLKLGGRDKESENNLTNVIDIATEVIHGDQTILNVNNLNIETVNLTSAGNKAVKPLGNSCEKMVLSNNGEDTEIDFPTAVAIRSKGKLKVGDMTNYKIQVDGFAYHSKQLKVFLPEEPSRYINGQVRDPEFDQVPNIYTEAAVNRGWLKVKAKPLLKDGRIQTLHIMNAEKIDVGSEEDW